MNLNRVVTLVRPNGLVRMLQVNIRCTEDPEVKAHIGGCSVCVHSVSVSDSKVRVLP